PGNHPRPLPPPGEEALIDGVAPSDPTEERLAVLGVAHRARRDGERSLCPEPLELPAVVGEAVTNPGDWEGQEASPSVHALAEPCDRELPGDLLELVALDVRDEEPGRVRPEVDRCDARHLVGRKTRSHRVRRGALSIDPSSTWRP